MKKHFATALVAMAATLGASHAQAQFSSASGPVTPPPLGSEANPYRAYFVDHHANGESTYYFWQNVSNSWYAAPRQLETHGAAGHHVGYQISVSPGNYNTMVFNSVQIGSFQAEGLTVSVNGVTITENFSSGSVLNFGPNVRSFEVYSRNGSLPVTSSNTLFPLLMSFTGSASGMDWKSINSAVPETETYVLMLLGLAVLGSTFGRRKSKA